MPETYARPDIRSCASGRGSPTSVRSTSGRSTPTAIAHAAAGAQTGRVRLGTSWGRYAADRRLFWVALIALLGALVWAMAIGIAGRPSTTPTIGRVAYTLDQHLYLADWDGSRSEVVRIPGVDAGATLDGLGLGAKRAGHRSRRHRIRRSQLDRHRSTRMGSVIGQNRARPDRRGDAAPLPVVADRRRACRRHRCGGQRRDLDLRSGRHPDRRTGIDLPRAALTFRPWGSLDWAPSGDRFVVTGCVGVR